MEKLAQLVRSRKFWAAVVGLALVVIRAYVPALPLDEEQVSQAVYLLIAYILGTSLEDGLSAGKAGAHG